MKSMRRFGLVLIVLFLGIIIGNFGLRTALLVFVPLSTLWFMLWDEKKYRQSQRRQSHEDSFYHETYYSSRHS